MIPSLACQLWHADHPGPAGQRRDQSRQLHHATGHDQGWRNQDIQALVNIGRADTVNSGRITGVKQNESQEAASDEEVAFFEIKKRSYDPQTGLNFSTTSV
jgi:hypothetical protein